MTARVRILVLTEDSGKQAQQTIQNLLKKALKLVVDRVDLNPTRVLLEPLPENERALQAVSANYWERERPAHQERPRLLELIANQLLQPASFVVFHFDTDRVWNERHKSERPEKFESIICNGVRRVLRGEAQQPINPRPRATLTPEQIEAALGRLIILSPCYSIESWLYQATKETREYCQDKHDSEKHLKLIESWSTDRTLLDEVLQPKDKALTCVADHYNDKLAKVFPAEDVWHAKRSFHESVERLRACAALVEALGS